MVLTSMLTNGNIYSWSKAAINNMKQELEQFEKLVDDLLDNGDFLNEVNGYFEGMLNKDNAEDMVIRYLRETGKAHQTAKLVSLS